MGQEGQEVRKQNKFTPVPVRCSHPAHCPSEQEALQLLEERAGLRPALNQATELWEGQTRFQVQQWVLADTNFCTSFICQGGSVESRQSKADGLDILQLLEAVLKLLPWIPMWKARLLS